jgi:23S rRNA pseudouridine1911/1915/1917 synthase
MTRDFTMSAKDGDRALPPASEGPLLAWLLKTLQPMPRTRVKQLLAHGRVVVNGSATTQFDHQLRTGDRVVIAANASKPQKISILHEDADLIVIDKAAGLLSVASDGEKTETAFVRLNAYLSKRKGGRAFVVHRLDRDTSGLLLFARNPETRDRLQAAWPDVVKTYLAIVEGEPTPAEGVVRNFLAEGRDLKVRASAAGREGAKQAVTHYRVMGKKGPYSLVEVRLETGRKHQIRVHLSGLGTPIIGDPQYGAKTNPAGRLGLHAWRLAFDHPLTGGRVEVESPLPGVLQRVVRV